MICRNCRAQLTLHNQRRHVRRGAEAPTQERQTIMGPRQRSAPPALRVVTAESPAPAQQPSRHVAAAASASAPWTTGTAAGGGGGSSSFDAFQRPPSLLQQLLAGSQPRSGNSGGGGRQPAKRGRPAAECSASDSDGLQATAAYMRGADWQVG